MNTHTRAHNRTSPSTNRRRSSIAFGIGAVLVAGTVFGGILPATADDGHEDAPVIAIQPMVTDIQPMSASVSVAPEKSSATLASAESVRARDAHVVTVHLVDNEGNPASGHAGNLKAAEVPMGEAMSVTASVFTETLEPGTYEATLASGQPGRARVVVFYDQNHVETLFPVWHPDVDLSMSWSEGVGDFAAFGTEHTVIVRLRDKNNLHAAELADQLSLVSLDDTTRSLTVGAFSEAQVDGEDVYVATVASSAAGQFSFRVDYAENGTTHVLGGSPFYFWWHEEVDVLKSHAETWGWQKPLGTDHMVLVRLRNAYDEPVHGLADRIAISAIDDATGLSWGTFTEEVVDGELLYWAPLSSERIGQSIITVTYDAGDGASNIYGTPIPVWWHEGPVTEPTPEPEVVPELPLTDDSGVVTAAPAADGLALSGAEIAPWAVGGAAALLTAAGAFLLIVRRRQAADQA